MAQLTCFQVLKTLVLHTQTLIETLEIYKLFLKNKLIDKIADEPCYNLIIAYAILLTQVGHMLLILG
jgi:hypothetical protein